METEKIKATLLAAACFFMACLNLWNIFKDWFDEKYQSRQENEGRKESSPTKKPIPDIIGKSKFKLSNERKFNQEEALQRDDPLKRKLLN